MDGSLNIGGRNFSYEIIEGTLRDGDNYHGTPDLDELMDTDQVFYKVQDEDGGEEFYRWVAGPFEDLGDLYAAIEDEISEYE